MKKNVKLLICTGLFMLLAACGSKLTVAVKEGIVIEYGSELNVENVTDQEGITIKEIKDFDSKKVGEQKITILFADIEGNEAEQEITLEVKDTKAPEIVLKEETMTLTEDDTFDPASNIESVKDVIDGDIQKSDDQEITQNGYIINSDVDNTKAGDYIVTITAFDVNGNKSESSYKVTVNEKPQEVSTQVQSQPQYTAPTQPQPQSTPTTNNSTASTQPETQKVICPRTGREPIDPTKSCDDWLESDYNAANPKILFNSFEEANQWGWEQLDNPEYYKNYIGYGASNACTNDGYCDWGMVYFYK